MEPSFLPSPPPVAKEFKDAYMAKYHSWEPPVIFGVNTFYALLAGLQKAQSLDPEKVAAALAGGLEFDTASGRAQMISRPDLKNPRTVDAVYTTYIAKMSNGKANVVATLTPSQGRDYLKKIFGW
jgi:ABC-type branched-subunit amino acid transport system substrate-binding protein